MVTTPSENNIDRLSTLPEPLLVTILTLLPTKTAITTSVLSHRWEHLWTQISHFSIIEPVPPSPLTTKLYTNYFSKFDHFLKTIDDIVRRLTSPNIIKFDLTMLVPSIKDSQSLLHSMLDSWVRLVCSRHAEDISVFLHSIDPFHQSWTLEIPAACIFRCETLVSLSLDVPEHLFYSLPNENDFEINLPRLKKLVLIKPLRWQKRKRLFIALFKSCPLLEELRFKTDLDGRGYVDFVEIVCPNLKTLDLEARASTGVDVEFVIDAPKLENLSIVSSHNVGFRARSVNQLCRLDKVELEMSDHGYSKSKFIFVGYVYQAFKLISSVRVFDLNGNILKVITSQEEKGLPVYQNLVELRVIYFDFSKSGDLFTFLKYCPNLEVLVLKMNGEHGKCVVTQWDVPEFEPVCLSTKLRVLELKTLCGRNYHMNFLEYMLGKESVLEKLVVGAGSNYSHLQTMDKEEEFCRRLFSIHCNSSVREINFTGQFITAASKGMNVGVPEISYRNLKVQ